MLKYLCQDGLDFYVVPLTTLELNEILNNEAYPKWCKEHIRITNRKYPDCEWSIMLACEEWRLPWRLAYRLAPEDSWIPQEKITINYTDVYPINFRDLG